MMTTTASLVTMNSPTSPARRSPLPPRWVIRGAWKIHRTLYWITRGRFGLRAASKTQWGMMRLKTVGRRSGQERPVILGFYEDGANLVTMAMNGWGAAEPAWWLNLQAHPDVTVELPGGARAVHGRGATADERPRLWAKWAEYNGEEKLASYASRRQRETAVVILEPRAHAGR